ncbi:MAG TPA: tRNA epoxyqueuosine(34) reductase QueG [Bacteroidia bacterium]|nr:tRNA epoxyqueuosine(34) reductase QueG [Bacteroidia bacterium]HNU34044.1 tRNA epoxyqueuosine(34) reductase QueG [Bacteroidia bacterium]
MNKTAATRFLKNEALRLGFDFCGISKAAFLEEEASRLENWLHNQMHGNMSYMERNFDKRLDPTLLVPGAKSVVSLLYNYFPLEEQPQDAEFKISRYAYGRDYHLVIKEKLRELFDSIHNHIGEVAGRVFVDSAPVLDRAWAKKSGLGWIGKNANLINPKNGSWFFIAELIIDLDLDYDNAIKDYCGTCTRCMDACPTDAIVKPYVVDGSKCISYFTIELKDSIPSEFNDKYNNWIFGCDICQEVCPWNRFAKPHNHPELINENNLPQWTERQWEELTEDIFKDLFKESPLSRTGFEGIKRNIKFVTGNKS